MAPMKVTAISTRAKLPVRGAAPAAAKPAGLTAKTAAVVATTGAIVAHPMAAEAAVTPSLQNLLYSVLAGGTVLFLIFGAVSVVAQFDPVSRK